MVARLRQLDNLQTRDSAAVELVTHMDATISAHLASILAARSAGRRLRTSQCIRVPASPELVRPGYNVDDQLWTAIRLTLPGEQFDLKVQLLTTRQALAGERRWFARPNCGRRVGCLYAPWINEPFWCRRCHGLLYDSVPHPVPWTHICAMPPGVAHTPRAPRSAFDTQASRDARSGCTAPRSRPRRRGRPRGSERFGRGSLAP